LLVPKALLHVATPRPGPYTQAATTNWRGRPLTSHEVIVQSIAAPTIRTGLQVQAQLDTGSYPAGRTISDADMAAHALARHMFHGDWNYTLHPVAVPARPPARPQPPADTSSGITAQSDPLLTGMQPHHLAADRVSGNRGSSYPSMCRRCAYRPMIDT
jgi:hypothetical protein